MLRTTVARRLAVAALLLGLGSQIGKATCPEIESQRQLVTEDGLPKNVPAFLTFAAGCYGEAGDTDALVLSVAARFENGGTGKERSLEALRALSANLVTSARLPEGKAREQYRQALEQTIGAVSRDEPVGQASVGPEQWTWTLATEIVQLPDLQLAATVRTACAVPEAKVSCVQSASAAREWLRVLNLTRRSLGLYSAEYLRLQKVLAEKRLKMWHAYRDDARPQFWWEYAINSRQMAKTDTAQVDGNRQGYVEIPSSQWIVLHPGAALEWRDAMADSPDSRAKPALYLELIGRYRWRWAPDTGDMVGGAGASLIVTYANRQGRDSVGYGVIFHSRRTKQFSFAVTRVDSDTAYLINVDLAEYVRDKLASWGEIGKKK